MTAPEWLYWSSLGSKMIVCCRFRYPIDVPRTQLSGTCPLLENESISYFLHTTASTIPRFMVAMRLLSASGGLVVLDPS